MASRPALGTVRHHHRDWRAHGAGRRCRSCVLRGRSSVPAGPRERSARPVHQGVRPNRHGAPLSVLGREPRGGELPRHSAGAHRRDRLRGRQDLLDEPRGRHRWDHPRRVLRRDRPQHWAGRRAYVLGQMVDNGAITQAESDAASAEEIKVAGPPVATIKAPHFVFQVRNQLAQILGGDEAAVSRGGYRVTTTLDMKTQEIGERQVREWVDLLHNRNVWNAALVSIDPRTGEVLTYVGSVDYYNRDDPRVQGQFDVAGIGLRQPGSSFKMFNYVTALKKGATAATVVVDARTDFGGKADPTRMSPSACGYCPENADLQYHGPVTMRQAIRESRNVPAGEVLPRYSRDQGNNPTRHAPGVTAHNDPPTTG